MTLIDASVWVDHLRRGNSRLVALLEDNRVSTHPFVIGELACGSMRNRDEFLGLLRALPEVGMAEHHEVMDFVETHRLFSRGIGWVDAHLLTAARLSRVPILTLDQRLLKAARALDIAA